MFRELLYIIFFFFNDTATTEIYTLSLHDALPIFRERSMPMGSWVEIWSVRFWSMFCRMWSRQRIMLARSEEHTSELQSRQYLVCRLLLEKKKKTHYCL